MRHQIGVVQREPRAENRSAASSYGYAALFAVKLCFTVATNTPHAAPPPAA